MTITAVDRTVMAKMAQLSTPEKPIIVWNMSTCEEEKKKCVNIITKHVVKKMNEYIFFVGMSDVVDRRNGYRQGS